MGNLNSGLSYLITTVKVTIKHVHICAFMCILFIGRFYSEGAGKIFQIVIMIFMWTKNWPELLFPVNIINEILVIFWIDLIMKFPHCEKQNANCILVSLCVYNNCKDNKLLVLAWKMTKLLFYHFSSCHFLEIKVQVQFLVLLYVDFTFHHHFLS